MPVLADYSQNQLKATVEMRSAGTSRKGRYRTGRTAFQSGVASVASVKMV